MPTVHEATSIPFPDSSDTVEQNVHSAVAMAAQNGSRVAVVELSYEAMGYLVRSVEHRISRQILDWDGEFVMATCVGPVTCRGSAGLAYDTMRLLLTP